jgi:hypothetical protein
MDKDKGPKNNARNDLMIGAWLPKRWNEPIGNNLKTSKK